MHSLSKGISERRSARSRPCAIENKRQFSRQPKVRPRGRMALKTNDNFGQAHHQTPMSAEWPPVTQKSGQEFVLVLSATSPAHLGKTHHAPILSHGEGLCLSLPKLSQEKSGRFTCSAGYFHRVSAGFY